MARKRIIVTTTSL